MNYWARRWDLFLKLRDAASATVGDDTAYHFLEAIDVFHRDFANRPITLENLTSDEKRIVNDHLNSAVLRMAYGFCYLRSREHFTEERLWSVLSGAEILRITLIADVFSPLLEWTHEDAQMRIVAVLHAELHLRLELKVEHYTFTVGQNHADVSEHTMRYHESIIDEYRLED